MPLQDIESIRTALYIIGGPSLIGVVLWFLRKMSSTLDKVAETCAQLKHESAAMQRDIGRLEGLHEQHDKELRDARDRLIRLEVRGDT